MVELPQLLEQVAQDEDALPHCRDRRSPRDTGGEVRGTLGKPTALSVWNKSNPVANAEVSAALQAGRLSSKCHGCLSCHGGRFLASKVASAIAYAIAKGEAWPAFASFASRMGL